MFAFACLRFAPETRTALIPPQMELVFEQWKRGQLRSEEVGPAQSLAMTLFYSTNNPAVSIAGGAIAASTFGVLTAEIIFQNGAMLGALVHELAPEGRVGFFVVRVLPHGITELSGIILSGAAGFVMAWALINPGRKRRGEALTEAGKDAIVLLATSVAMMFIAAPIEGFISFNERIPEIAKIGFAAASAVFWGLFWVGYGRAGDVSSPG